MDLTLTQYDTSDRWAFDYRRGGMSREKAKIWWQCLTTFHFKLQTNFNSFIWVKKGRIPDKFEKSMTCNTNTITSSLSRVECYSAGDLRTKNWDLVDFYCQYLHLIIHAKLLIINDKSTSWPDGPFPMKFSWLLIQLGMTKTIIM
jgi:hypothetical protein